MESTPQRITKRIQQATKGNWGSDKYVKKHTEINQKKVFPNIPKHRSKKQKRQRRAYWRCPFCHVELPLKPKEEGSGGIFERPIDTCPNCKAHNVPSCPCCHHSTWMNSEGRYKHLGHHPACGFDGFPLDNQPENNV